MISKNQWRGGFAFLIFLGFFAHLPDLGGDTPTRLLFGWAILFALIGFFGLHALARDTLAVPPTVLIAGLVPPVYFLLLGGLGHSADMSFAWTPALVVFSVALFFTVLANSGFGAVGFDRILIIAVLTQGLLVLGGADHPFLAAIPGPVAWPSQKLFVHGGYWQVNVMSNVLGCLTLWSLWHLAQPRVLGMGHKAVFATAFILFPLTIGWANSLSGIVFLLAGLCVLALALGRQKEPIEARRFWAGVAAIIISLIIASVFGLGAAAVPDVIAKASASSLPDRLGIWLRALYAFSEAPLFGHGLGHFASIYNDVALRYEDTQTFRWVDNMRHGHNIVLHNLVEIGLVGTFILLAPFVVFGVSLLRAHPQYWVAVAILTPIFGHMLTGYPQRQSAVPLILAVIIMCHMAVLYGRGRLLQFNMTARMKVLRLAVLSAFVLPAMAAAIMTGIDFSRASVKHMQLTHPQYDARMIPWRLSQPDLTHPFLGYQAQVQSIFGLTSRAAYAQDRDNLPPLLARLAIYEKSSIRGTATWGVLVRGYIVVGAFDKAREIMDIAAALNPAFARRLLAQLDKEVQSDTLDVPRLIAPSLRPAE